jgi:hypothetical protein
VVYCSHHTHVTKHTVPHHSCLWKSYEHRVCLNILNCTSPHNVCIYITSPLFMWHSNRAPFISKRLSRRGGEVLPWLFRLHPSPTATSPDEPPARAPRDRVFENSRVIPAPSEVFPLLGLWQPEFQLPPRFPNSVFDSCPPAQNGPKKTQYAFSLYPHAH